MKGEFREEQPASSGSTRFAWSDIHRYAILARAYFAS